LVINWMTSLMMLQLAIGSSEHDLSVRDSASNGIRGIAVTVTGATIVQGGGAIHARSLRSVSMIASSMKE
jgi:hypothetical protein